MFASIHLLNIVHLEPTYVCFKAPIKYRPPGTYLYMDLGQPFTANVRTAGVGIVEEHIFLIYAGLLCPELVYPVCIG